MENTLTAEPTAEEIREAEAVLSKIFAQVERVDERTATNQQETEMLCAQTRKTPAKLKAL